MQINSDNIREKAKKYNRRGKVLDCGNRIKGFEKLLNKGDNNENSSKED